MKSGIVHAKRAFAKKRELTNQQHRHRNNETLPEITCIESRLICETWTSGKQQIQQIEAFEM